MHQSTCLVLLGGADGMKKHCAKPFPNPSEQFHAPLVWNHYVCWVLKRLQHWISSPRWTISMHSMALRRSTFNCWAHANAVSLSASSSKDGVSSKCFNTCDHPATPANTSIVLSGPRLGDAWMNTLAPTWRLAWKLASPSYHWNWYPVMVTVVSTTRCLLNSTSVWRTPFDPPNSTPWAV